jgi:DNA-directed RNA polymerase subunit K/omega
VPVLPIESHQHVGEDHQHVDLLALSIVRGDVESVETRRKILLASHAVHMVRLHGMARPDVNRFEFVIVAALRAQQLTKGCVPLLAGQYKATTMAQMEVSAGKIARVLPATVGGEH